MTTMTRPTLAAVLLCAAIATTGCFTPAWTPDSDKPDAAINKEKVILLDRYVAPRIFPDRMATQRVDFFRDEYDNPSVSLEMRSLRTSYQFRFDIRTAFKDAEGRTIDVTAWSPVVLAPGETYLYRAKSAKKEAADAQVQIREMQ